MSYSFSYQYFGVPAFVTVFLLAPTYYYYQHYPSSPNLVASPIPITHPIVERTFWPPRHGPLPAAAWIQPAESIQHVAVQHPYSNHGGLHSPSIKQPTTLEDFPQTIKANLTKFENWAGNVQSKVWVAYPENAFEIIEIANWARFHSFRVRPSGHRKSWSPLTISQKELSSRHYLLIDTTAHLHNIQIDPSSESFWAEPGATLRDILTFLEENDASLGSFPPLGEMSLGGLLATGSHGLGIPTLAEDPPKGHTFGTLSNLILSLTAVVYDPQLNSYALKEFKRSDPEMRAFLVNFGTTMITNVTLRTGPPLKLAYKSELVNPEELFSSPLNQSKVSFLDRLNEAGRALAIFSSEVPNQISLRTWTAAETKPEDVTEVESLTFSQKDFSQGEAWGTAKSVLLYANPEERTFNGGWLILTNRTNIQRVVHEFYHVFNRTLTNFRKHHPNFTSFFEIKVNGLDNPGDVVLEGAVVPAFSSLQPIGQRPDLNCSVGLNIIATRPEDENAMEFYTLMEECIFDNFNSHWSVVRVEWPYGWGFTKEGPWRNWELIKDLKMTGAYSDWDYAVGVIQKYDPWAVFADEFVNDFLLD